MFMRPNARTTTTSTAPHGSHAESGTSGARATAPARGGGRASMSAALPEGPRARAVEAPLDVGRGTGACGGSVVRVPPTHPHAHPPTHTQTAHSARESQINQLKMKSARAWGRVRAPARRQA